MKDRSIWSVRPTSSVYYRFIKVLGARRLRYTTHSRTRNFTPFGSEIGEWGGGLESLCETSRRFTLSYYIIVDGSTQQHPKCSLLYTLCESRRGSCITHESSTAETIIIIVTVLVIVVVVVINIVILLLFRVQQHSWILQECSRTSSRTNLPPVPSKRPLLDLLCFSCIQRS